MPAFRTRGDTLGMHDSVGSNSRVRLSGRRVDLPVLALDFASSCTRTNRTRRYQPHHFQTQFQLPSPADCRSSPSEVRGSDNPSCEMFGGDSRSPSGPERPEATATDPRASAKSNVAQRCLHGSPCGLKYGHVHEANNFEPRRRTRTRYFEVPRTLATTSPALAVIRVTRPLTKYDWPRERTASLKFRELSGRSPLSVPARDGLCDQIALFSNDMQAVYLNCK